MIRSLQRAKVERAVAAIIELLRSTVCNNSERKVCCQQQIETESDYDYAVSDYDNAVFLSDYDYADEGAFKPSSPSAAEKVPFEDFDLSTEYEDARIALSGTWPGKWPHMCALLLKVDVGSIGDTSDSEIVTAYLCGASLIAPDVVLTSANCVSDENILDILAVRCGEWDTQTEDEPNPFQERKAKKIVKHPEYDDNNLHNDFSLVFTSSNFILEEHI